MNQLDGDNDDQMMKGTDDEDMDMDGEDMAPGTEATETPSDDMNETGDENV
jgi:hypothetical protein